MGELYIGACSWTDKTLLDSGKFYPPEVKTPEERLRFYATQFPIVEVDGTYYALPTQRMAGLWAERTPPGFLFHIKAFSLFTGHAAQTRALPRELRDSLPTEVQAKERVYQKDLPPEAQAEAWRLFREALLPLDSAGKLGMLLFQFPPWFVPRRESLDYILHCQAQLPQYRLAIEFRNNLWLSERDLER
ncbi:MAG: DUF72 domain-containing protein, partial [Chloroflexota bacterium]|nr:DUF72 domain-containing protein [Chloroflexota bacterium]